MINYNKELVEELSPILPVHYELFVDQAIKFPCITYKGHDNYDTQVGDTVEYANMSYMIKVWSDRVADLEQYGQEVHVKMRALGFKRINTQEMFVNGVGQRIMVFEATSYRNNA